MRYSAMVPTGVFHCCTQDTNFKGYFIPKNTLVVSNLYACMKDPKIWNEPDAFKPERFLSPDGSTVVRNEALLPFSTGDVIVFFRICILLRQIDI